METPKIAVEPDHPAGAERPAGPLGVLGTGCLLLAVLGSVLGYLGLWRLPSPEIAPEDNAALEEAFAFDALPLGWQRVPGWTVMGGAQVYLFEDPDAAPAPPLPEDPPAPEPKPEAKSGGGGRGGGRGGRDDRDREQWSRLAEGEAGLPPRRLALLAFPERGAELTLENWFQSLKYKDLEDVRGDGEAIPMDSGRFDWGDYEAPYIRVRHLYKNDDDKPTFHETVRVNLTTGRRPWIAVLTWDERLPADPQWAERAVEALAPRE